METITNPTAAAPRALSTPASPSALFGRIDSWRDRVPALMAAPSLARTTTVPNHNSISTGVTPVKAGRGAYGAAKQAAPPRGELR